MLLDGDGEAGDDGVEAEGVATIGPNGTSIGVTLTTPTDSRPIEVGVGTVILLGPNGATIETEAGVTVELPGLPEGSNGQVGIGVTNEGEITLSGGGGAGPLTGETTVTIRPDGTTTTTFGGTITHTFEPDGIGEITLTGTGIISTGGITIGTGVETVGGTMTTTVTFPEGGGDPIVTATFEPDETVYPDILRPAAELLRPRLVLKTRDGQTQAEIEIDIFKW